MCMHACLCVCVCLRVYLYCIFLATSPHSPSMLKLPALHSPHIPMRTTARTHTHTHSAAAAAVSVTASSSSSPSPLAQPLFSFLFAATAAVKTNSNAPVNGCVERKAIKNEAKRSQATNRRIIQRRSSRGAAKCNTQKQTKLQLFFSLEEEKKRVEVCVCACSSVFKPVVKCALQLQQQQLIQRQQQQQQQKHLQHTLIRLPDRAKEQKTKQNLKSN